MPELDPNAPAHQIAAATIPVVPDTELVDRYLDRLEARIDRIGDKLREALTPASALEELAQALGQITDRVRSELVRAIPGAAWSPGSGTDQGPERRGGHPEGAEAPSQPPPPSDREHPDDAEFFSLPGPGRDDDAPPGPAPQPVDLGPLLEILTQIKEDTANISTAVGDIRTAQRLQ